MDALLISEVDGIRNHCLSLKSGFSINLLVCEFYPQGQTWYQKFIGTYPPLGNASENMQMEAPSRPSGVTQSSRTLGVTQCHSILFYLMVSLKY